MMTTFERFLALVCGTGLAYILLYNFATGQMAPQVYQDTWATATVFVLSLCGVMMALLAVYDYLRKRE